MNELFIYFILSIIQFFFFLFYNFLFFFFYNLIFLPFLYFLMHILFVIFSFHIHLHCIRCLHLCVLIAISVYFPIESLNSTDEHSYFCFFSPEHFFFCKNKIFEVEITKKNNPLNGIISIECG